MTTPAQTISEPTKPAPATPGPWMRGRLRGTRATITNAIEASGLSAAHKAVVLEEIAAVPEGFDLLELHYHRDPHKNGANWTCTVSELS